MFFKKIKCSITFQIDSGHIENKRLIMSHLHRVLGHI